MREVRTLEACDTDKYPYPIQIHLIDTRILDLDLAATIYLEYRYPTLHTPIVDLLVIN